MSKNEIFDILWQLWHNIKCHAVCQYGYQKNRLDHYIWYIVIKATDDIKCITKKTKTEIKYFAFIIALKHLKFYIKFFPSLSEENFGTNVLLWPWRMVKTWVQKFLEQKPFIGTPYCIRMVKICVNRRRSLNHTLTSVLLIVGRTLLKCSITIVILQLFSLIWEEFLNPILHRIKSNLFYVGGA